MQRKLTRHRDHGVPGICSRSQLCCRLEDTIRAARSARESFALFLLDIDDFREINNYLGPQSGDAVLGMIAERLSGVLGHEDQLLRVGGDEFALIVQALADEEQSALHASHFLEAVRNDIGTEKRDLRPQASIGIACYPHDGEAATELIAAADLALAAAKRDHKGSFVHCGPESLRAIDNHLATEDALHHAFIQKQFAVHYQPQVDLKTGRVVGVEALVRWQHPQLGLLEPGRFLPALERNGRIPELDEFVIQSACAQLRQWRHAGREPRSVSINVSASHLTDPRIIGAINESLHRYTLHPACLEIEITETSIQHEAENRRVLNELSSMGIRLAIDDFGTGFSSLASLKHLPIQKLKVDRMFIRDILINEQDAVLLGAIIGLAHAMGYEVVAEGVEDLRQVQVLAGIHCDAAQGYFFSRPLQAEQIPALMRRSFSGHKIRKASR